MKRLRVLFATMLLILIVAVSAVPWGNDQVVDRYADKIWLHRTNTVEKLAEFEDEYLHFECDVQFLDSACRYEIGHDEPGGVALRPYFDFLSDHPHRRLWLDVKNLSEMNYVAAESALTQLLAESGADKTQLIVESPYWRGLRHFTQRGYYTSCYLQIPRFKELSSEELSRALDSIQHIAHSAAVSAISFPASYYSLLREQDWTVDLLTWEHHRWAWQLPFSARARAILADNRVKVVLVKEKGAYHQ